jgi:hypothetical protein
MENFFIKTEGACEGITRVRRYFREVSAAQNKNRADRFRSPRRIRPGWPDGTKFRHLIEVGRRKCTAVCLIDRRVFAWAMKTRAFVFLLLWAGVGAGCSTVDSRIARRSEAFSEWPAAVQEKVRAGQIDVGFTPEQVRVALGDPARTSTRTNTDGTSEVWVYRSGKPRVSFGVGLGTSRGSTAYGGGVNVGTGGNRDDDAMRVVFSAGRVSAIETPVR